jgi:hypothetical protein
MSVSLLKEYVTLLTEGFDIRFFKSLGNPTRQLTYAWENLSQLGKGSARTVFKLNNRQVLKVGVGSKGLAQNQAELDVFTNPASKPILARIFDYDRNGWWLIEELVRPLTHYDEFERLTGVDFDRFIRLVDTDSKYEFEMSSKALSQRSRDFVRSSRETVQAGDLSIGDVDELTHWGKTPDGRVVMLDYGYTKQVMRSPAYKVDTLGHQDATKPRSAGYLEP